MKFKKFIRIVSCFIIYIMFSSIIVGADTTNYKIITESKPVGTVQYEGYNITAGKIKVQGSNNVAYCLEIDKSYPSGQSFSVTGNLDKNIENIIAAGYPNRTYVELDVDNEDEAYFATQIAIWCAMKGYDVNKLKGDDPYILDAIRTIYNDGMSGKYANKIRTDVYKTNDQSIQEVAIVHLDDLVTEQKAESIQKEYAPQEG